jgi:hypothetical protein
MSDTVLSAEEIEAFVKSAEAHLGVSEHSGEYDDLIKNIMDSLNDGSKKTTDDLERQRMADNGALTMDEIDGLLADAPAREPESFIMRDAGAICLPEDKSLIKQKLLTYRQKQMGV